ncbi:uncharacterized protein LOC141598673 isoform X2 [Silene latifolia]|uniref:uncharacterized protein LOC141598673 isoform X2 n=1 Tax=Silene latifolia TaxID=37657 RepID=UPI003D78075B
MGESLLESPKVDNKMGESVTNVPCFQQSVSFGRFERDNLCWERWSTFPTNKYLEEVEKCSTPGSVAQKKAYFEAHYKKIAARRAELLLDQEREREAEMAEDSASVNLICNTSEKDLDNEITDTDDSVSETDHREDEVDSFDHGCMLRGLVSPSSEQTIGSGTESVSESEGELGGQSALYLNPVPSYEFEPVPQTESNTELCNTGFDGEVTVEHVHVKSNTADVFCQENETGSSDGEVSVEHVHLKSDSADVFNQENDVQDRPSEIIEYDDGALHVNDVSELSNVKNALCENVDEYKDGDNTINEASVDMDIEVTKEICEVSDCANVIDETVKIKVAEHFEYPDDGADLIKGYNNTQPQEEFVGADLCPTSKNHELGKLKLSATPSILKPKGEELPQEKVKRTVVEEESRNLMKLVMTKKTQKATLVKKTVSSTNTKKQSPTPVPKRITAPMPKSTMLSTPKSSKLELIKGGKSAGRLLDKKENGFTPPTVKKTTGPQSRRLIPTSLHMSLSLGPMNSDQASLTMRKSLIMERMGDKDIVKRAFKAFQNPPQISPSSVAKSPLPNQSVSRKAEQKGSPANIIPNKNEGIGKAAKTPNTRTSQQGIRKTSPFPKVTKNGGADQRNVKSVAASFGPRVLLQGKSQNEASKKLDLQANTNISGTTHLLSKHKAEKAAQLKKPSQNSNTNPKPASSFGHKHGGSLHKEDGKAKA